MQIDSTSNTGLFFERRFFLVHFGCDDDSLFLQLLTATDFTGTTGFLAQVDWGLVFVFMVAQRCALVEYLVENNRVNDHHWLYLEG